MKRLIALIMVMCSILTGASFTALAVQDTDNTSWVALAGNTLSPVQVAAELAEVLENAKASVTTELVESVAQLNAEAADYGLSGLEDALRANSTSGGIQTYVASTATATYDDIHIETVLNLHDGVSVLNIAAIGITHANAAKNEANSLYPNDAMKRDTFRHMTWNFRSQKAVGHSPLESRL
ncbi:hypothetical protein FACS1894208_10850 [Clostridia bacterium]|nr:hypothetical protein FACS1894208_10850 [Clostridia bacterium]